MTYVNDGNFDRFVAISPDGRCFHAIQGGLIGEEIDYVRVDESLDVEIREVLYKNEDGSYQVKETPFDVEVVWS